MFCGVPGTDCTLCRGNQPDHLAWQMEGGRRRGKFVMPIHHFSAPFTTPTQFVISLCSYESAGMGLRRLQASSPSSVKFPSYSVFILFRCGHVAGLRRLPSSSPLCAWLPSPLTPLVCMCRYGDGPGGADHSFQVHLHPSRCLH